MHPGIQDDIADFTISRYGCYAICLLHIVELEEGVVYHNPYVISSIHEGMKLGYIKEDDCTVLDADKFLYYLFDYKKRLRKEYATHRDYLDATTPMVHSGYVIKEWYNERTKLNHFTMPGFDPLRASITVREGYVRSARVFRPI